MNECLKQCTIVSHIALVFQTLHFERIKEFERKHRLCVLFDFFTISVFYSQIKFFKYCTSKAIERKHRVCILFNFFTISSCNMRCCLSATKFTVAEQKELSRKKVTIATQLKKVMYRLQMHHNVKYLKKRRKFHLIEVSR